MIRNLDMAMGSSASGRWSGVRWSVGSRPRYARSSYDGYEASIGICRTTVRPTTDRPESVQLLRCKQRTYIPFVQDPEGNETETRKCCIIIANDLSRYTQRPPARI